MGKIKICFVDDHLAPQPEFVGWSYSKQKGKIDNFVQQNESQIIKEVKKVKHVTPTRVNFQIINQKGLLPFPNTDSPILKQLSDILLKSEDFEVKFVRKLNEIEDADTIDLLVLDIVGVLDDSHNNLPNIPFVIFSGCLDIDQEIKSHPKFIKFYTRSKDNFELLMSGIEKCAKNNQINTECFDVISPQRIKTTLLHLFLPLDIDMQALEIIKDDAGKVEKNLWGDKDRDIEGMFESRDGDKHYRQKLYDLWHLLGKQDYLRQIGKNASSKVESFTPIDNPSPFLRKLAGLDDDDPKESPVYNFLEFLDKRKKDGNNLKEEVDYLLAPFKSSVLKIGNEEINSFHDWYCAMDLCLRG